MNRGGHGCAETEVKSSTARPAALTRLSPLGVNRSGRPAARGPPQSQWPSASSRLTSFLAGRTPIASSAATSSTLALAEAIDRRQRQEARHWQAELRPQPPLGRVPQLGLHADKIFIYLHYLGHIHFPAARGRPVPDRDRRDPGLGFRAMAAADPREARGPHAHAQQAGQIPALG